VDLKMYNCKSKNILKIVHRKIYIIRFFSMT
jgi:hypothetical protein